MYCRDGCRCEQQYRLHRLLAYDPNNECRGIFSDWFKFPSCCICRCYDLPLEFRVTSRSPRLVQRQRLKVRTPRAPPRQRLYNWSWWREACVYICNRCNVMVGAGCRSVQVFPKTAESKLRRICWKHDWFVKVVAFVIGWFLRQPQSIRLIVILYFFYVYF